MQIAEQLSTALRDRYHIEREIGRGGMATVYLARDVRHERFVALKVLDPELGVVLGVERFLAEIRVTAHLQHPNLLPLFDSGEANGLLFYVMPFVEGESLRSRLDREHQLPIAEAIHIAISVAGALDYAHAHGVVHRDLKPENILIQAGEPLVADFGIALAVSNAGGARVTQTGLSLGTPQYMSPEQATGDRHIDRRSDVYSLGAVLYEMLVGDPPHTGSTARAIIAKVLTDKPRPVRAFRETVPEHVADAVDIALAKLPADRFATAAEFAHALVGKSVVIPAGAFEPSKRRSYVWDPRSWVAAAVGAIGVAAVALTSTLGRRDNDDPPLLRTTILPPPGEDFAGGEGLALSNDGTMLAFTVLRAPPRPRLFVRPLASDVAREIPGTADAQFPFWSPDNKQIGFFAGGELRIVDIDGRATPSAVARVASPEGGSWARNGLILFAGDPGVIYRVRPGEASVAVTKREAESVHSLPGFLPDGRHFLFTTSRGVICVGDVRDGSQRQIALGSRASFAGPGQILLDVSSSNEFGRLAAIPFDAERGRIAGNAVVLEDSIFNPGSYTSYTASATGVLVLQKAPTNHIRLWLDRRGVPVDSISRDSAWTYRLSHDGRFVAQGGYVLSVRDLRRGVTLTLPNGSTQRRTITVWPVWAPDDSRLAFLNPSAGSAHMEVVRADGTGEPAVIGGALEPLDWTSDGRSVLASGRVSATNPALALWLFDVDSKRSPEKPWLAVSGNIAAARFSPNGRWVAYQSDETGESEVYVRQFPGSGPPLRISPAGGGAPVWRADGRELYYLTPAGDLAAVTVTTGARFDAGTPQVLFRGVTRQPFSPTVTPYDVSPDGQHFLVYTENRAATPPLTVLAPWQRLLSRR